MAIDIGIGIACDDLQATGGISQICLRSFKTADTATYVNTPAAHGISAIQNGGGNADWFVYEFKNETAALTVNATKENGSTAFECGLSFSLPKMTTVKFHELQNLLSECMMAICVDTNGTELVVGLSEKYENEDVTTKNQTYLNLVSMEGGTGAAYSDENSLTINLMAKQYELPRVYSGTLTVDTSGLTATTT